MPKTRFKRFLSMVLTLCMVLTMIAPVFAANDPVPSVSFTINGASKTLTGGPNTYLDTSYEIKNSSYTGDWVAYFNKDNGSLTLKNYNSNGNIVGGGSGGKDLKLILEGDNYINNGSLTNSSGGDITITSGEAASLTIKKHDDSTNPIVGIHTVLNGPNANITISGKTNINIDVENSSSGKAQGIYARGDVKIKDNASLNIKAKSTGGTVGHLTSGIFSENGSIEINTSGDLMIDTRGAGGNSYSYALYAVSNNHTLAKVNSMILQWTENVNQGGSHNRDLNYNESDYYIHTENNKQTVSYFKKQVGKYLAKIKNGEGTNVYSPADSVTIKADEAKESYTFESWKTEADVTFADQKASNTTFTMPEEDIEIVATYTIFDKQPEFTKTGDNSGLITWSTLKATTDKIYIEKKNEGGSWSNWQTLSGEELGSGDKSYEVNSYFSNGSYRLNVQPEGDAWLTSHEFEINWDGIGQPTYSVTVNDGSTNTPNPKEGDIVTIKANPAPDGKEFDKWTSEDGINFTNEADITTTFTMPGKDITVNASYKDIDLSMTDTNLTNLTASYYNGSHIYTDLTPKFDSQESNYSLDLSAETQNTSFYLYTKEGQSVSASVDGSSLSVFEANESDPYNYSTNSINMDKAIKIVTLTVTAKDGKTTKDYTITINWAGAPIEKYAVTYNGNGNTSGTVPTDSTDYTSGTEVTVADKGDLEKTNYIFDGWNTKADGTGTDYAEGEKFNITEDITLYAKWILEITKIEVKTSPNKTEYADQDKLDLTGLVVTVTYADTTTEDIGFSDFEKNHLTTSFAHYMPITKTENKTLNVHWDKNNDVFANIEAYKVYYRITFDAQGGTVSPASALTKGNSEGIILGESGLPTPTKEGYSFNDWFSQSVDGDKIDGNTQFNQNTTIYAQWTKDIIPPENYTVTVQDDGNGTGSANPSIAEAGTETNLTATANTGYKFKEWEVISGGVTIVDNKFTMPSENVVIKAIFEEIPVDKSALTAAITSANTNKGTAVVSTDGTDVDPSDKWVSQAEMDAYETAISTAQALADKTDASQTEVDNAVAALNTATNTFNNAKKAGIKITIEVTKVTISPKTTEVQKGTTAQFTASVEGTGSYDDTVTWDISGNNHIGTTIDTSGLLTVALEETATSLTVTATSNGDSNFSDDATVTLSDIPITTYTVTVNNGTGGGTHAVGATVSITADSPPAGQEFDRWVSSDVNFANENNPTTTFEMPASDVEVTATYKDLPVTEYTVTVQDDGNGIGSAYPSTAVAGTEINLTATADTGYKFKEWQVISGGVTITSNKFTMPDNDVVVKAVFEEITPQPSYSYTITEGADSSWDKSDKKGAKFVIDGDFGIFQGIKVNGKLLDVKYYKAEEGSVIVTLLPEYLKTLARDEYTIGFIFSDREIETSFKVTETNEIDPTDPTDPVDPIEPTDPTGPVIPVDPAEPKDPVKPKDPASPTVPEKLIETLPTTGENSYIILHVLGLFFLTIGILLFFRKRRQTN